MTCEPHNYLALSASSVFTDTYSLRVRKKICSIARAERDGTRAETRFRLSPKRTSPFKSVGASVQSTACIRGVRISFSNAGYTMFGGGVRVLATHSIRQFPLHFPSRPSPCAIRFRTSSNYAENIRRNRIKFSRWGDQACWICSPLDSTDQKRTYRFTMTLVLLIATTTEWQVCTLD